ncbi:MAG: enoyl-CoA hydratase, partial [Rhodobacteraceae bacterium]|nr:enoyl-CoA hydratase [Paracoccaceae bacterium]
MNASGQESLILRHDEAGVRTITMNRGGARNALSRPLLDALLSEFEETAKAADIKVVILAGAGPAFCAGHDLKELRANTDPAWTLSTFEACARVMIAMTQMPQPVIARVHGIATAAGCQLVATVDLAVAANTATFATPGVNIGLFCSTPMVALTRNVGRKKAMEMLLTGRPITADEAERSGLINRAVAPGELDAAVTDLAQSICAKSPKVLAVGKRAF